MHRRSNFRWAVSALYLVATLFYLSGPNSLEKANASKQKAARLTQGSLQAVRADGQLAGSCPLKHTDVQAEISGSLSRVTVTQTFENSFAEKIEAVYTFPLPQDAAVDDMTMIIGERTVKGKIMRREEALAAYTAAKTSGKIASLLDQERPNIFTQAVANILPGQQIKITISYVETLKYEGGRYEFVFPMVVGPRYVPGDAKETDGDHASDVSSVPDASRISPPVIAEGMRAGHDISINLRLDTGVPLDELSSTTHEIDIEKSNEHNAVVRLKDRAAIPNKDFVVKYDVAGPAIENALLAHRTGNDGFFTLIMQPPDRVTVEDVTPKELVFVLDTSGSMEGFPLDKAKETVKLALDHLYPQDTFNLITFSGDTHVLFDEPVAATPENVRKAKKFLGSRKGDGGTEMMKAIRAALQPSDAQDHLRIACFMTDGYVGNDMEIIAEVKKHSNARVFSIGFGSGPNRFLLDKMAEYGRGEVEYVLETDDGSKAAQRFFERVRDPLLTDISVDWAGLPIAEVYPQTIPDLFSAKPIILSGRYLAGGSGVIRLKGKMSGREIVREIPINLPEADSQHDVLATLWARRRIDYLMGQDMAAIQRGTLGAELREAIVGLGLKYKLLTQFTSFVAIEERIVTDNSAPLRVEVPVETPSNSVDATGSATAPASGSSGITGYVTVTDQSGSTLNTADATTSTTIESRTLVDLPLNARGMIPLIHLAAGVAPGTSGVSSPSQPGMAVNGQRPDSNNFMIDGVNTNPAISPADSPSSSTPLCAAGPSGLVSIEAIQEMSVRTYGFQAEFGRSTGAQTTIVTRGGTNEFHGALFEYFGNDRLDANDWFANARGLKPPAHRQNIFGGTLGGPVRRDQTFFFGSYEGSRLRQPFVGITDVPSIQSRVAAPGAVRPFLDAFPLPTGPPRTDHLAEFASSFSTPYKHDTGSIRIDSNPTSTLSLFGRYNFTALETNRRGGGFYSLNTVNSLNNGTQSFTGSATSVYSPNVLIDLRMNYTRVSEESAFTLDNFGGAIAPLSEGQVSFFPPRENTSSLFDLNARNAGLRESSRIASSQHHLDLLGSVNAIFGNHTLKLGGEWVRLSAAPGLYQREANAFFNGVGPALQGIASRFNLYQRGERPQPVFNTLSIYGQDEWRYSSRLTLSYGLRWELAPSPSGQNGQSVVAATGSTNPSQLNLVLSDGRLWQTTYNNIAPRAGVAYQLSQESGRETVIRAGIGVLYDTRNRAASDAFTDSFPSLTGRSLFNIPLTANVSTAPNVSVPVTVPVVVFDPHLKLPYTIQWHAGVDRALGSNQSLSLAYVGSIGRRLMLTSTLTDPNADFSYARLVNNDASSSYRALQLRFDRRSNRGLEAHLSYTWAKSQDDVSQDSLYRAILLSSDRRLDRALSDFDVRHQLTGTLSYRFPSLFESGLGNTLSRNWVINSLFYARSARPLNVVFAIPTSVGLAFLRPDTVAGIPLYVDDLTASGGRRINAAAFAIPAIQRQGTLARNALQGFPFHQIDVGLARTFTLREEIKLQLGVEFFNLLNHPNFQDPLGNDLSVGTRFQGGAFLPNSTFGQSASMAGRSLSVGAGSGFNSAYGSGGPRSLRFAFRFEF